jgi:hypothetical protein
VKVSKLCPAAESLLHAEAPSHLVCHKRACFVSHSDHSSPFMVNQNTNHRLT